MRKENFNYAIFSSLLSFDPLQSKYSPQYPVLKTPSFCALPFV